MAIRLTRPLVVASVALSVAGASWAFVSFNNVVPAPKDYAKGFDSISVEQVKEWMEFLAGPETQGRGSGQPGFQKAADFMAARFKEYGLKPIGDDGTYFQNLPYTRSRLSPGSFIAMKAKKIELTPASDIQATVAAPFEASGELAVVRANGRNASLASPEALAGKIVIVFSDSPRSRVTGQINGAGAKGVFTVTKDVLVNTWSVRRSSNSAAALTSTPPAVTRASGRISEAAAMRLIGASGEMPAEPGADQATMAVYTTTIDMSLTPESEQIKVPNVVGLLEGSDPTLAAEHVGIGAHLDHLGVQNGRVYPGADDDASGNSSMLAVLKAFHDNPKKPRRSVLFMAFCGEEMGLVGSRYYADNPILPLNNMVAELQMDMVGRNEETSQDKPEDNVNTMHLVGSKRLSMELHNIIIDLNKHVGFEFEYDQEDVYTRSDHYSFAAKGVPVAFVFSGFHPDYHQPTDTLEKINYEKIANAGRLFYLVASELANRDARPKKDATGN